LRLPGPALRCHPQVLTSFVRQQALTSLVRQQALTQRADSIGCKAEPSSSAFCKAGRPKTRHKDGITSAWALQRGIGVAVCGT
jgi:hypothetical protein